MKRTGKMFKILVDNNIAPCYNDDVTSCNKNVTIDKCYVKYGGFCMKKLSKKLIVVAASAGVFASSLSTYTFKPEANEFVYTDENVSITSIIDHYIEVNNGNVFASDGTLQANASEDTTEAMVVAEESTDSEEETLELSANSMEVAEVTTEEPTTTEPVVVEETAESVTSVQEESVAPGKFDFTGKAVVIASGSVNIRKSGDINADKVGLITSGGIMTVVEKGDTWSHITSGNVDGYIKNEFVAFDSDAETYAKNNLPQAAYVNTAALKLRTEASTESESITILAQGECYPIESIGDAWTKIQLDSKTGYVKNDYILISYSMPTASAVKAPATADTNNTTTTETPATTEAPTTEAPADQGITAPPASGQGQDVANYAVQFVGNPYVWGGTSLTNGADCSGFVQTIYKNFGYSIPRTADVQGTVGTQVSLSAVAPGDLIFYDHGTGSIKHVALYIGDGKVVHASSSRTGIIISNMNYNTPCRAVRIIN